MKPNGQNSSGELSALGPVSTHFQLLPYLDNINLYNGVNINAYSDSIISTDTDKKNSTSASTIQNVFLCPSDSSWLSPGVNYRACVGSGPYEFDNPVPGGGGVFSGFKGFSDSNVSDGLSQTAGFSERLRGNGNQSSFDKKSDIWYSGIGNVLYPISSDAMKDACASLQSYPLAFWHQSGSEWLRGRYADTLYNHVAAPNAQLSDCSANNPFGSPGSISAGSIAARSNHPGGVNTLLMDGSAKFVRDGINIIAWRALASRSGGDLISSDSF
jgi:prepilin-type processing-associated H-X9-DG protein